MNEAPVSSENRTWFSRIGFSTDNVLLICGVVVANLLTFSEIREKYSSLNSRLDERMTAVSKDVAEIKSNLLVLTKTVSLEAKEVRAELLREISNLRQENVNLRIEVGNLRERVSRLEK